MKFLPFLLAAALVSAPPLKAQDPNQILEGARLSATLVNLDDGLDGYLSHDGRKIPIKIYLKGKNIQFLFQENKQWRVFHMRLADNRYDLFEIINGKTVQFDRDKLVQPIAGTDLTYEDLALRFFYWPNPKLEGKENVGAQPTFKLRVDKPGSFAGNYKSVYVWVHQKYGAFMQIKGYDTNGKLIKEFQVEEVMKVARDTWGLERMQVATFDPGSGRRSSITDMVLKKPNDKILKGLR